jgi:hypothetical protein
VDFSWIRVIHTDILTIVTFDVSLGIKVGVTRSTAAQKHCMTGRIAARNFTILAASAYSKQDGAFRIWLQADLTKFYRAFSATVHNTRPNGNPKSDQIRPKTAGPRLFF